MRVEGERRERKYSRGQLCKRHIMYVKEVINLWIHGRICIFLLKVKQNATVLKNQGNNKVLIRKWRSTSLTISYSHAHKSDSHSDDSSDHT